MGKKKVNHGDIIEIPLPNDLGFSYAKYIDLLKLVEVEHSYPCLMLVYKLRTMDRLLEDYDNLNNLDLLFSPLLVGGVQPAISKSNWKVVANLDILPRDIFIPEYKQHQPDVITNDKDAKEWFCVSNLDIQTKTKADYNKIRHLETFGAIGSDFLGIKIAMGMLKAEAKDINSYFKLETFPEKVFYNQVMNTPLYYEVPEEKKGRI